MSNNRENPNAHINLNIQNMREGPLIQSPSDFSIDNAPINYNSSAIGLFTGPHPPLVHFVQHIVNSRWIRRGEIMVHRSGPYFLFECNNNHDLEGIVKASTTIIDGRVINLRRYQVDLVPNQMSFNLASIWVRVHGLPLAYLTTGWARQILRHVGYIEEIDQEGNELPAHAELRARHATSRCPLHAAVARRRVRRRLNEVEADGIRVLYGPAEYPFYSNYIRGLPDSYRFRNSGLDLRPREVQEEPSLYRRVQGENMGFDEYHPYVESLSSHDSEDSDGFHTGEEDFSKDDSGLGEVEEEPGRPELRLSPGRRLGLGDDPYAEYTQGRGLSPNLGNFNGGNSPLMREDQQGGGERGVIERRSGGVLPIRPLASRGSTSHTLCSLPSQTQPIFKGSTFEMGESSAT
uniref:DUF4283 domain-containing protein n=1 Tax=Chenopodium quinoa TaxID=63459 RepID=A0A803N9L4_CHEQI